jgi:hypothetical protein
MMSQSNSIHTPARRFLMVGFAYRASIQALTYELGTSQHHISARHTGYQTVFLTLFSP